MNTSCYKNVRGTHREIKVSQNIHLGLKLCFLSPRFVFRFDFLQSSECVLTVCSLRKTNSRERDRDRDRQTDRETETERDRERQRERQRERVVVVVIVLDFNVLSTTQGHLRTVKLISKHKFLNSSHIYINPLSSQSTKPITLQT